MGSLTKTVSFNVNQPKYGQDSSTVSVGETVTASQFFVLSRNDVGSLTMASNSSLVANSSQPIFTGTVNISITEGVAGSYSFAQNFVNPVDSYSLTGTLPVGFNFDDPTGLLSWTNAVMENTTPGFTVTATNTSGVGITDTFSLVVNASSSGLILATGHYEPAVQNMTIVAPRPDTETSSDEANRLWPSQKPFRYPVNVRGGARPHNYELTSAPSGMTIGAGFGDADYGIITWANPVIGTYTVSVRVRSQEFNRNTSGLDDEATVSFELTVRDREDSTYFVWIDPAGNNANDGSYSNPVQTIAEVYNGTAYAGKQCHLFDGTHSTTGCTQRVGGRTTTPKAMIGAFTNTCIVNATDEGLIGGTPGAAHMGFDLAEAGYGVSQANARYVFLLGDAERYKWFNGDIVNPVPGTTANDNPATFFSPTSGTTRLYVTVTHGEERGRVSGTAVCSFYSASVFFEFFDCVDTSGGGVAYFLKDANPDSAIYNCFSDTSKEFEVYCQDLADSPKTARVEVAYNKMRSRFVFNRYNRTDNGGPGEIWVYRNSIQGVANNQSFSMVGSGVGPANFFANASVGPTDQTDTVINESKAELHNAGSGIFDADLNLTGSARTNWLGRRGAEIE